MVGRSRPGECAIRKNSVFAGGSSRLFRSALAALAFMSSAGSTMTMR
jgi:hypothetical protein